MVACKEGSRFLEKNMRTVFLSSGDDYFELHSSVDSYSQNRRIYATAQSNYSYCVITLYGLHRVGRSVIHGTDDDLLDTPDCCTVL